MIEILKRVQTLESQNSELEKRLVAKSQESDGKELKALKQQCNKKFEDLEEKILESQHLSLQNFQDQQQAMQKKIDESENQCDKMQGTLVKVQQ